MNVAEYLSRIDLGETELAPNIQSLRSLQSAHLLTVPFENLDIHWQRPIVIDTEKFFSKIVDERRGGFCYELNGLFNELLRDLGFRTRLVSARVFSGNEHGPEFDHAAIVVTIGDDEYLADVGFGAFTAEPLRLALDDEQQDANGAFLIRKREDGYLEVLKREDGQWRSEYMFMDVARDLAEFSDMCDFQQYAPDSHFRKGKLCSIMTTGGRKTLTDKSFVVTREGNKDEITIGSEDTFNNLLKREFGISKD